METKKRKIKPTSLDTKSPEMVPVTESEHWQCLSKVLSDKVLRDELYHSILSFDQKKQLLQLILKEIRSDPKSALAHHFLKNIMEKTAYVTTFLQDDKTGIQDLESKKRPTIFVKSGRDMLPLWEAFWTFLNAKFLPDLEYRLKKGTMAPVDRFRSVVLGTASQSLPGSPPHRAFVQSETTKLFSDMPNIAQSFWVWIQQYPHELQRLFLDQPLPVLELEKLPLARILPLLAQVFNEPAELQRLRDHYFREDKINELKHRLGFDSMRIKEFCNYPWNTFPFFPTKELKDKVNKYVGDDCENLKQFPCLQDLSLAKLYAPPPHPSHPFPDTAPPGIGYQRAQQDFSQKVKKRWR